MPKLAIELGHTFPYVPLGLEHGERPYLNLYWPVG